MKRYQQNYLEVFLLVVTVILAMFWVANPKTNIEPWIVLCGSLFAILEMLRQRRRKGGKDMYVTEDGLKILMIQSFADRREWGITYHCTNPKRVLKKVIKVFGGSYYPVSNARADQCINKVINTIMEKKPDIIGIGGKGSAARQITEEVSRGLPNTQFGHWGKDTGCDACGFLELHGVLPPY